MATPVETPAPQGPEQGTGASESGAPVPEAPGAVPSPPAGTETPPQPTPGANGLPGQPLPDGTVVSGRGSNQDAPTTPTAPADPPSPQEPSGDRPRQEVSDLPEWAQQLIKETRDEVAKTRVNAKQQAADEARKQMAQDIAKALGIANDDTPPEEQLEPDQLRDLLAGERNTARQARVELAVFKAAQGGGGFNASALLDSRAFLDSIKEIDPTDSEALNAKIAEAVQANPWLAVQPTSSTDPAAPAAPQAPAQPVAPTAPVAPAPVAPPSGGQFAGGPGAQPQDLSTMSIDDFRRLRRNAPRS